MGAGSKSSNTSMPLSCFVGVIADAAEEDLPPKKPPMFTEALAWKPAPLEERPLVRPPADLAPTPPWNTSPSSFSDLAIFLAESIFGEVSGDADGVMSTKCVSRRDAPIAAALPAALSSRNSMASSCSWSLFIALPLYAAAAFWSMAPSAVRLFAAISGVVERETPLALTTFAAPPALDMDAVAGGGASSTRTLPASLASFCGLAIASAGLWVHSEQILSSSSLATRVLFPSLAAATSASTSSMSTSLSMSLTSAKISARNSVGVFSVYATSSSLYLRTCTAY
mmetsp:Transcript_10177/g.41142  ORF Transcript_10177/g.41142 Transcript_10177/m.41142 type:complete len:283 (-) Transcript_10177:548-1396(-)